MTPWSLLTPPPPQKKGTLIIKPEAKVFLHESSSKGTARSLPDVKLYTGKSVLLILLGTFQEQQFHHPAAILLVTFREIQVGYIIFSEWDSHIGGS